MTVYDLKIVIYSFLETLFGQKNVQRIYLHRSIKLYREKGLLFIHIPKSAGTTVARSILGRRAGHFTASEILNEIGLEEFNSMFSFSVVRNPFDRLASAYHYARQGGGSEGSVRKLKAYNSEAFSSFQSFVKNWLVNQDLTQTPIIFRPQYLFVCNELDDVLVQYIAHAEELDELSDMLKKSVHISADFNQLNTTARRHYTEYYTEELSEIVYNLYRKDFELFGYSPDLTKA